ncbi:sensor histidine kinase [Marisediminicola antarctica]|uniref:histidine kinase n=1 Tax=Marisediminicola antarctica TaxID=674079 RepID=A0A7L5AIH3_9MICO|nr:HAMP domain-containing sensor histidine kinase [Marisediminicola antarctica]QHO69194.1 two-component sensor histidine kinase [Marisediminicola antarctica]
MSDALSDRWNSISLRTKITSVTVLLVTLGLLVAGAGTMTVLRNYLLEGVDSKIAETVTQLRVDALLTTECVTQGPNDYYVAIVNDTGRVVCHNAQDDPPILAEMTNDDMSRDEVRAFTLWDDDRSTQWRVVALPQRNVQTSESVGLIVALNLDETNGIIARYAGIFLGFGLSVVVLGAALTRLLVTTTFAPLRQVEATAAAIADGNFSERLPGATPNTEVGRLNGSLNTMLARIDRAFGDRAKTIEQMRRFVGDASHELRTPLVSVRGYAELYRMGALTTPDEVAQAMERIEKEAIRMGELVEDLLELARIDEAKPLQMKPVDLVPIAYDAALDAMASSPGRPINVVFIEPEPEPEPQSATTTAEDAVIASRTAAVLTSPISFAGAQLSRLRSRRPRQAPAEHVSQTPAPQQILDTPAIVLGEENKIRQVVTNLLGNALRFTNPGSPIEIGVSVDAVRQVALLDIIDHGEGIPPQIRDKIFQRFWRADTSRTRETGGSGLGLAIVSGIIIAHKGSVDVFETEGGGATFRIELPLLPENYTSLAPTARP